MGSDLVSVVIPVYNEETSVRACLESVLAQDHRDLQVLVVAGPSTDRTDDVVAELMSRDDRIEVVRNPRRSIPASLNLGLARCRGTWLVRVDAHSTVGPEYVGTAVERLREGRWGGVGGRKDAVARTASGRAVCVAMGSRFGVGNSTYHHGTTVQEVDHLPFGAYPVGLLRQVGGWDERLVANEDFELDHRLRLAGYPLLFDPRMVIRWSCRESVADLFRQYRRYGKGKVDVVWLHPRSVNPRHVLPPAFVAYAATGLVVNARTPRRWLAMMAPYAAAVAVASVRSGRNLHGPRERLNLPAAYVAMHVGWGVGFWLRLGETLRRRAVGRH